jgi:hypothetical protein
MRASRVFPTSEETALRHINVPYHFEWAVNRRAIEGLGGIAIDGIGQDFRLLKRLDLLARQKCRASCWVRIGAEFLPGATKKAHGSMRKLSITPRGDSQ